MLKRSPHLYLYQLALTFYYHVHSPVAMTRSLATVNDGGVLKEAIQRLNDSFLLRYV